MVELKTDDEVTIKIGFEGAEEGTPQAESEYKYKIVENETFTSLITNIVETINAGSGNPLVYAIPNPLAQSIILTSRQEGSEGNSIPFSVTLSTGAVLLTSTSGATLSGGQDAAQIAPGTVVSIVGAELSTRTESADPTAEVLPTTLADTQVYFDGVPAPLFYVSPTQINAQVPFENRDRTSINAYVRTRRPDGVTVTTPVAVSIVPQNPGIFTLPSETEPRPGLALHGSAAATATISLDGTITAGDVIYVTIEDKDYSYTVQEGDTNFGVRDKLVEAINADEGSRVRAVASGFFTRIRLIAKIEGPEGIGIQIGGRSTNSSGATDGATLTVTPFAPALCCPNQGLITEDNPAIPGETFTIYATGLGLSEPRTEITGVKYRDVQTDPQEFVAALFGGKTANVLLATLKEGEVGVYQVDLELNGDIPTNPLTQGTIFQSFFVSNIITIPVVNPIPPTQ